MFHGWGGMAACLWCSESRRIPLHQVKNRHFFVLHLLPPACFSLRICSYYLFFLFCLLFEPTISYMVDYFGGDCLEILPRSAQEEARHWGWIGIWGEEVWSATWLCVCVCVCVCVYCSLPIRGRIHVQISVDPWERSSEPIASTNDTMGYFGLLSFLLGIAYAHLSHPPSVWHILLLNQTSSSVLYIVGWTNSELGLIPYY